MSLTDNTQQARAYAVRMQKSLVDVAFWKTCLNCEHWRNNSVEQDKVEKPMCRKFNILPPPEIIVHSCVDEWLPVIPF